MSKKNISATLPDDIVSACLTNGKTVINKNLVEDDNMTNMDVQRIIEKIHCEDISFKTFFQHTMFQRVIERDGFFGSSEIAREIESKISERIEEILNAIEDKKLKEKVTWLVDRVSMAYVELSNRKCEFQYLHGFLDSIELQQMLSERSIGMNKVGVDND